MTPELSTRYRITPRRGAFHVEAVTADGAIDPVAMCATEDAAVRQLRELQRRTERRSLAAVVAEEAPRGPRGQIIPPAPAMCMSGAR